MTFRPPHHSRRWESFGPWIRPPGNGPIILGCNGSDASTQAIQAARDWVTGLDVVLVTATTGRHRLGHSTVMHDALKADAYLLTDAAITDEHLRSAREAMLRAGATSVRVVTDLGDPVTVLSGVAARLGAEVVVVGMNRRPSWLARALRRRIDDDIGLVVTDGTTHLRARRGAGAVATRRPATIPQVGLAHP
ncbi:hypothetical protein Gbro_3473 [Gordonia bronchialis DSM 43247]|uniref:UspA domain-containing protein n=1 Tax=Gordonia bronchialis (strain ATCC 25592 / DSM 43247 / BCRC 13721 / JCM 3198 / KCTC 3076 / NBRC 16047 / NCTC 10667) TaxID=526226 RepID=D0LE74_GORB4|nr:universal stress protein [Gordonia bronchialis]ACY22666.1 hypothetical protein Gbro_3473 [Gordonia bronchialis DSM 43247]MCC3325448.1 universal stress protein [Gordonia bronchialis]QGS23867.1 universal stress protein [Gordonia bronchialis]STQ65607.1 Universal stress protein family [Gordonia bronchialis]